jgi:hypothetical protein
MCRKSTQRILSHRDSETTSRRIVSTRMQRMTAGDAPQSAPKTAPATVLPHRLDHVVAACRLKAAALPNPGTQRNLVQADKGHQQVGRQFLNVHRASRGLRGLRRKCRLLEHYIVASQAGCHGQRHPCVPHTRVSASQPPVAPSTREQETGRSVIQTRRASEGCSRNVDTRAPESLAGASGLYDAALPTLYFWSRLAARPARRASEAISGRRSGSAPARGTMTKSTPVGNSSRDNRNASRSRRFQRFRTTALPTLRETDRPTRACGSWFSHT